MVQRTPKNNIFPTLCVMTLSPVVPSARLAKHKVVRPEDLSVGPRADRVHGAWLQVDEDSPGHVLSTRGLIVVDIDSLQLEVGVAIVSPSGVDAMLIRDDFPELENIALYYK